MDAKMGIAAINIYNFQPNSDLIQEEDCDTLLLHLPGFTKEHLRVRLTHTRVLTISGSRPIGDNKLSSFQQDFPVPPNIDTNKITAKFEDGILYLRQPKLVNPDQETALSPTPQPQKPAANPPPAAQKTDHEQKPTDLKATEKSEEKKVEKRGETGPPPAQKTDHERKPTAPKATEKSEEKEVEKRGETGPPPAQKTDHERKPTAPKATEKSEEKKVEKRGETGPPPAQKTDHERKPTATKATDKSEEKKVEKRGETGGIDESNEGEKIYGSSVNGGGAVDDYNAAAMVKMIKILVFFFALAIGVYVSKLRWFSSEAEK